MVSYASFEDFLYIILGLVWIVFSIYNANRKKKARSNQSSKEQKRSLLDSLLDEMGVKTEEENYSHSDSVLENEELNIVSENKPERVSILNSQPEELFSYDDYYKESNYKPTSNVIVKKQSKLRQSSSSDTGTNNPSKKKKTGKIDLRKAVIYSEILKKQYF